MGIDVTLEDEKGRVLESLADEGGFVAELLEHSPAENSHCLAYIDEFGDTTFNRLQVARLLQELREIPLEALNVGTRQFLSQLRAIAETCVNEVHKYLKFSGD